MDYELKRLHQAKKQWDIAVNVLIVLAIAAFFVGAMGNLALWLAIPPLVGTAIWAGTKESQIDNSILDIADPDPMGDYLRQRELQDKMMGIDSAAPKPSSKPKKHSPRQYSGPPPTTAWMLQVEPQSVETTATQQERAAAIAARAGVPATTPATASTNAEAKPRGVDGCPQCEAKRRRIAEEEAGTV